MAITSSNASTRASDPPDHGARLFDLFLRFNRRLQALLNLFDSPLSTGESHFLGELLPRPDVISRDLAGLLSLDKSTISRMVSSLEKRGLLNSIPSEKDKREKRISIAQKGLKFLDQDIEVRTHEVQSCVYRLGEMERTLFEGYLKRIADALNSPIITAIWAREPLLREIRRLTRSMGFIGESVIFTDHPVEEVQILYLTYLVGGQIALSELGFSLPYIPSDLSRHLERIERKGFLKRKTDRTDKRRVTVTLTQKGINAAETIKTKGSNAFNSLIQKWSFNDTLEFIRLLEKCLECPLPRELLPESVEWNIREFESVEEKTKARSFLIEQLVRLQLHQIAPHNLIDPIHRCFSLTKKGELIAILELEKLGTSRNIRVLNFIYKGDLPPRTILLELLSEALPGEMDNYAISLPSYVAFHVGLPENIELSDPATQNISSLRDLFSVLSK